jgi:hypothetical protein
MGASPATTGEGVCVGIGDRVSLPVAVATTQYARYYTVPCCYTVTKAIACIITGRRLVVEAASYRADGSARSTEMYLQRSVPIAKDMVLRTSAPNAGFPVLLGRHALQGLCTAFSGRNFSVEFGGGRGPDSQEF